MAQENANAAAQDDASVHESPTSGSALLLAVEDAVAAVVRFVIGFFTTTLLFVFRPFYAARRLDDPAFQQAFPWFNTVKYWEEQVLTLREQLQRIALPPLLSMGE